MPNSLGLYTLEELRSNTRRLMNGLRGPVNPLTGDESTHPSPPDQAGNTHPIPDGPIDTLFSNQDLNFLLNSALTGEWVDATASDETAWEDEQTADIQQDTPEIPFPPDLALLRGVDYLDPAQTGGFTIAPPSAWLPMHLWSGVEPLPIELVNQTPTYRRNVQGIVLNDLEFTHVAKSNAIRFRYIKHMQPLTDDNQTIETQFARELQEVIMRAAAVEGLTIMSQLDTTPLMPGLTLWRQRLAILVRNSYTPPVVRMVGKAPALRRGVGRGWGLPKGATL